MESPFNILRVRAERIYRAELSQINEMERKWKQALARNTPSTSSLGFRCNRMELVAAAIREIFPSLPEKITNIELKKLLLEKGVVECNERNIFFFAKRRLIKEGLFFVLEKGRGRKPEVLMKYEVLKTDEPSRT